MAAGWLERMRDPGGPLVDAAARFVEARGLAPYPEGADGLRRLGAVMEGFVFDDEAGAIDEAEAHRFVEGAGALLGLLLIAALGGRHHEHDGAHRVALGPHGFFDPFAAVDGALDAESPRGELARRVAAAEAEAAGRGPVSRVVGAFARALPRHRPELSIAAQRELSLELSDGTEVDLASVARATDDQPDEAVEQAVDRIAALLGGGSDGVPSEEARARLLPRLVPERFARELAEQGRGEIVALPVAGELRCALVLGYGDRARYVRPGELAGWQLDAEAARAVALQNLAARSADARFGRLDTEHGPLVVARSGDGLDAARLLLPALPEVLAAELSPPFVVAVPHRDALLACSAADAGVVEALRARAREDAARAPHAITDALYELDAGRLGPWERG